MCFVCSQQNHNFWLAPPTQLVNQRNPKLLSKVKWLREILAIEKLSWSENSRQKNWNTRVVRCESTEINDWTIRGDHSEQLWKQQGRPLRSVNGIARGEHWVGHVVCCRWGGHLFEKPWSWWTSACRSASWYTSGRPPRYTPVKQQTYSHYTPVKQQIFMYIYIYIYRTT